MSKKRLHNNWHIKNSIEVYSNNWIDVTHHDVITPNNTEGIYGIVHFKNIAIGVLPIDDIGNTFLVGQYRLAIDAYSWEIPEGGCPLGNNPIDTAARELKEETGIIAQKFTEIARIHLSNSVTDELGIIYVAEELSYDCPTPEDTEDLLIKKCSVHDALSMVLNGQITDSLSQVALLKYHIMH